jgi:hypothetical protein
VVVAEETDLPALEEEDQDHLVFLDHQDSQGLLQPNMFLKALLLSHLPLQL